MKDYERLTERDEFGNADIIGVDSEILASALDFDKLNKLTFALNKFADLEDKIESGELCDRKKTARDIVEMLKVAKGVVKVHFEAYDELIENIVEKYGLGDEDENVLDNCVYKHPYPQEGKRIMTERENILIDALISAGHIAEQARTAMEKLKAENTELRHRAEVAERALKIADKLGELCGRKEDYVQQAEKELAEEKKDEQS